MSKFPLDEPFSSSTLKGGAGIDSVLNALEASEESSEPWTPRRLGMRMNVGGLHPVPIGSVEQVADVFQEWVNDADCDGFNVAYVSNPESFEDVVELLIPELQRRGMYWDDYDFPKATFRENLLGTKMLRDDHYGSRFKYYTGDLANGEVIKPAVIEAHVVLDQKVSAHIIEPKAKFIDSRSTPIKRRKLV